MRFILEIELGNDAMQRSDEVALTLQQVGYEMRQFYNNVRLDSGADMGRNIRDINGNTVGKWEVTA